jgi:hypothetical protein
MSDKIIEILMEYWILRFWTVLEGGRSFYYDLSPVVINGKVAMFPNE